MFFNRNDVVSLINDEFVGEAPKRALQYIQKKRTSGMPVAGAYCVYAPVEIIRAAGAVPAILCAFANKTIQAGEAVLPANLCPLVKSSLGFIVTDTCPFFALSDAVIAETTCDGKKKMFELISHYRPMHVMDLPQMPDAGDAQANWASRNREVKTFLEKTFSRTISENRIEEEIKATNRRNKLMARLLEYAAERPPLMSWSEFYEIAFLAQVAFSEDIEPILEKALETLAVRKKEGIRYGKSNAPRVLVTGSPLGGDALKVYRIIEEAGGVVVALDNCTGMKPFVRFLEEDTGDPISAVSRYYLKTPCACMTPNSRRLDEIDRLVALFKPDVVIDVVLHACHTYNIESHKVMNHTKDKHRLPFLKIETDYSDGDVEQIRTRVEALFDSLT